ncbi:VWA domain-containing protein [Dactylosporangium sp. AC04546]|uniref:vWA domain-containing protein n=1 Tax=Dactylosporangium sp. AC04546 TaxID=2862460 RepID=UPI001EE04514|nr:vWA domain-containing protein [Dactylosporangium sp. AC04546]WVK82565.1 VWA domain-containing protein [Dactylosporangium sp. AC04546]
MYSAEINRNQPACLLLLIDQSTSMSSAWADTGTTKAGQLALAVNRILGNAVMLCTKGDNRVFDYFEVGILGYGEGVRPILHGARPGHEVLPISELAFNPMRLDQVRRKVPDGGGGVVEIQTTLPVWVDAVADGWTPMVAAMQEAERLMADWCAGHRRSFPPIVMNITDGESTDGDPRDAAARLRSTGTGDGGTLLFNIHLASGAGNAATFPDSATGLPDHYASLLFDMSSPLPPPMSAAAEHLGYQVQPGSRGFLYNAEAYRMIEFLDIGTRAATPTGLLELTAGPESMR